MKTKIVLLSLLCVALSITSCEKKGRGTIFSSRFDSAADLNLWTQSMGGEAVIEQDHLKLKVLTSCFAFETVDVIRIQKGKTYTLKFKGKVDPMLVGEPAYCVGNYMVYVVQGSDYLIHDGFGDYAGWTPKSFSFEATSSAAVRIRFLIGTEKGAWLDELELIED